MKLSEYLKKRVQIILLFLGCDSIYPAILFLYGLDTEPVWYAFFLCSCILVVVFCADFIWLRHKHERLQGYDPLTGKRIAEFVTASDVIERDYQEIVQRLAEYASEADTRGELNRSELGDFYALWVHQIKTPIAALGLLLQINSDNLSDMKNELFQIERYVDIVLGYLRIQDMNQDLLFRHYSLEGMVSQAVKKYSVLFIHNRIGLKLTGLDKAVLTDEKWMVFVLEQLISNAVKYTSDGEIRISACMMEGEKERKTILSIRDTGIGICPEDLPRIFEKSFTGYNGRMDKKASGLGLYLCHTILRKLGHAIEMESVPGKGTEVRILFTEKEYAV